METRNRRRRRASWANLPEDMLGDVLRRLPSFGDRARLRAVCRGWRAAWRRQPHPPAPWLSVPGHCVSLPDGAIHRVARLTEDARNTRCVGSLGDWLALVPLAAFGGGAPFLLNPFSSARILLPSWTDKHEPIRKIVMSSAPDSSCVVAAMVDCDDDRRRIAACRPGEGAWWQISLAFDLQDIVFHEGRLHALASCNALVVFDDGELDLLRREPWRLHEEQLPAPRPAAKSTRYLWGNKTAMIEVHALEPDDSWARVRGIVGHALFIGDACSRAFPAASAAAASTSHDMIRENQVCFVNDELAISQQINARNRSDEAYDTYLYRLFDVYLSVFVSVDRDLGRRCLRTVEAYVVSERCGNVHRPGDSSAQMGQWQLAKVREFPRSIPGGHRLRGFKEHEDAVVI
ncbi:unnamed protein product [Alopecurus aequalis]